MTSSPRKEARYPTEVAQEKRSVLRDAECLQPFLPKRPAPIGFIYHPSEQSSDSPCVSYQKAYDSPCRPTPGDTTGNAGNNEWNEIIEEEIRATHHIVGVVILVVAGVLIGVVYFLMHHPRLAYNLYHTISNDADGNATSLGNISAAELTSKVSAASLEPPGMRHDDDRDFQPSVHEE